MTPSAIRSWNISFIIIWNVAGLLVRPKYMTRGSNKPLLVQNVAFHLSPSQMQTLLYSQWTSSLVKEHASLSRWIRSSMRGNRY
jgi:hypothetical protein